MSIDATAATGYNGHSEECMCTLCLEADMTAHIRATRTTEDADRLLAELGTIITRVKGEGATFEEASKALDVLFKAPSKVVVTTKPAIRPGMYWHGEDIVKVQMNREGTRMYGQTWRLFDKPEPTARGLKYGTFDYTPGILGKLDPERRMTLEEAQAMGVQFHFCCVCGIELTNDTSIDLGIGPVCRSKF